MSLVQGLKETYILSAIKRLRNIKRDNDVKTNSIDKIFVIIEFKGSIE